MTTQRIKPSADLDYGKWQLQLDFSNRKASVLDAAARAQRLEALQRLSFSPHGQVVFERFIDAVCQSVNEVGSIAAAGRAGPHFAAMQWIMQMEDPRQVSALALQVVIDSISREIKWSTLINRIGSYCETETRAGRLKTINRSLFKAIRNRFYGRALTYSFHSKRLNSYGIASAEWGPEGRAMVGAFLLDRVIESTGLVHITWKILPNKKKFPCVVPAVEVLNFLKEIPPSPTSQQSSIRVTPPEPWSPNTIATYKTGSVEGGLVRLPAYASTQREELNLDWLPPGSIDQLLLVANYLQSVPHTLSSSLAELASRLWLSSRHDLRPLFPCSRDPAVIPPFLEQTDTAYAWKQRNRQAALAYTDHRVHNPTRIAITRTINSAQQFAGHPLYFPVTADYRSRLYAGGDISYQGSPIARSLVSFHPSVCQPLSPSGFQWCLRAAASTSIGRKTSFDDRLTWAQDNLDRIQTVAADPYNNTHLWIDAADPWRHLAACQAVTAYLADPSTPIGFPIYFDQSCSGLGHAAALTRDLDSATKTRITTNPDGNLDLYELIAADLLHQAQLDLHAPGETKEGNPNLRKQRRARYWCKHGIDRSIVKEVVISAPYGIKPWGIRSLITDQLIRRCKSKDPRDLVEMVDGPSIYLTDTIGRVMKPHLTAADALKTWLQLLARTIAATNQPLQFTTPSGFTVRDAECKTTLSLFNTVLNGRRFGYHHISPEADPKINSAKLQSRITANYIHSVDASLCIAVINSFASLKLPIATIHDCFATTPNHADTLHQTLVHHLHSLHQHPWLTSLHQELQSTYNLQLPPPPLVNTLDPASIGSDPMVFS